MNFTREPIIETVITPKDGYKLVVRSSKTSGQEEFFVDAVEVISFGRSAFFRSLEKPKCFLVPVSDYEVLEVRESRMVLKTTGTEKGIKIGGGREAPLKVIKEEPAIEEVEAGAEQRVDKRRERRRSRKKRGKGEQEEEIQTIPEETPFAIGVPEKEKKLEKPSLIPPPPTLISESIARYKSAQSAMADEEQKRLIPPPPSRVEPDSLIGPEEDEIPF